MRIAVNCIHGMYWKANALIYSGRKVTVCPHCNRTAMLSAVSIGVQFQSVKSRHASPMHYGITRRSHQDSFESGLIWKPARKPLINWHRNGIQTKQADELKSDLMYKPQKSNVSSSYSGNSLKEHSAGTKNNLLTMLVPLEILPYLDSISSKVSETSGVYRKCFTVILIIKNNT